MPSRPWIGVGWRIEMRACQESCTGRWTDREARQIIMGLQSVFPTNSSHALENSADVEVYPTTSSKFRIMIFRSQPFSGRLSSTVSGYSLE